jgi:hypothetical protein
LITPIQNSAAEVVEQPDHITPNNTTA